MLDSRSLLFSIHRNLLLRWLLKKTFYAQFCAGENSDEVREFVKKMERVGYSGVALEYASEVLEDAEEKGDEEVGIERWERGILDSIEMSREGSFVAFKVCTYSSHPPRHYPSPFLTTFIPLHHTLPVSSHIHATVLRNVPHSPPPSQIQLTTHPTHVPRPHPHLRRRPCP